MKRFLIIALIFISAFLFMSYSPAPTHTSFGGEIYFINESSYDLYWEFDIIDKSKGGFDNNRLCLEKKDTIVRQHKYSVLIKEADKFDKTSADPNNYLSKIRIYDMKTGSLLIELLPAKIIFNQKEGSIENCDAVFEMIVDDSLLSGGQ